MISGEPRNVCSRLVESEVSASRFNFCNSVAEWAQVFSNESLSLSEPDAAKKTRRVMLAPYGDWPNQRGLQRFQKEDAQNIVNEFESLGKRALNPSSWLGLPWYEGHPDHPDFRGKAGHTRSTAVGRIKGLEAGNDGLYANVKFNEDGERLIVNESYHGHSVNWFLNAGRNGDTGKYRPFKLKSVGFTNEPNIPVPAVTTANSTSEDISLRYRHMAKLRANGLMANSGTSEGVKKSWASRLRNHHPSSYINEPDHSKKTTGNYEVYEHDYRDHRGDREDAPTEHVANLYAENDDDAANIWAKHIGLTRKELDDADDIGHSFQLAKGKFTKKEAKNLPGANSLAANTWSDAARKAALEARQGKSKSAEYATQTAMQYTGGNPADSERLHRNAAKAHGDAAVAYEEHRQAGVGDAGTAHREKEKYHSERAEHYKNKPGGFTPQPTRHQAMARMRQPKLANQPGDYVPGGQQKSLSERGHGNQRSPYQ